LLLGVNPLRQKSVRAPTSIDVGADHVTVCADPEDPGGRRTRHVNTAEGLAVVLETVGLPAASRYTPTATPAGLMSQAAVCTAPGTSNAMNRPRSTK